MIEIYKYQFQDLNSVISQIKDRNYRFIIYMDDLSFEDFEIEYKYLKAVIEGGLEKKPSNVLIYATSNRRHLVRENSSDNADKGEDMHTGDTVQEKLSLSERFGVRIYFGHRIRENMMISYAASHSAAISAFRKMNCFKGAGSWEIRHGGRSGRTAQQYIDYLMGKGQGAV
jgi:predicted AAA+ superfamily ATPase